MQVKNTTVHEFLSRLRLYFQENDSTKKYANEAPPLRSELFNTYQMEQHGKHLAKTHQVRTGHKAPEWLLKRLADNEKILIEVRNLLIESIKEKNLITPGGEWLLDNFYLIEEQIRTGKRHLPKGYSQSLPNLINGPSSGLPRVYDIALEIISHSDGRIDIEGLRGFIESYQSVTNLKLGELWAIPIMLRLALIENLRRVSARIAIDKINRKLADYWAKQMIETAVKDPKSLILVIADMARSNPPMESSFVAELIRQLMWKGPTLALPLTWMEQRLSENRMTSNELVNRENQKQAADQVSISNSIGSLRFLSSIEWREFVESMSIVEQNLRKDIEGVYGKMDFPSRDRYRHVVERIAHKSAISESEVAEIAVRLAKEGEDINGPDHRSAHVGYYLIDKGLEATERQARMQFSWKDSLYKQASNRSLPLYVGIIGFITFLLTAGMLAKGYAGGTPACLLVITGILSLIATSQLAVSIVNWAATLLVAPRLLPRMDFSEGIPSESRTLVVVPTLINSAQNIESLVEALEVRFLANRNENLSFGLLTDFPDAKEKDLPGDAALLELAQKKTEELNQKYGADRDIFFLFHRPRLWNPNDHVWMGYERKRGKLTELNALLRHGTRQFFSLIGGDTKALSNVKYVITLDTDTLLPRDAAWKMVATMAHPLNRPVYNEKTSRVMEGFGILQPRAAICLPRSNSSIYEQIHANDTGIDPYTRVTSDVYQDLFDQGSFIGKGIYDIDAFERSLKGRFPENRILSHDLLEGCYARSGLLSDVQLYEAHPSRYSDDVSRRHRWIRGDWQIAWWFLPIVPDAHSRFAKNTISALSRWKIFDNLRRSLVSPALVILLLLGWSILSDPWFWTLSVVAIIILPGLIFSTRNFLYKSKEISFQQHLSFSFGTLLDQIIQNVFMLTCLPYEAYYSLDAIIRTSWRMLVSHKKLLEWKPSGHHENSNDKTIRAAYLSMWISPVISVAAIVYLIIYDAGRLGIAAPFILAWILSPLVSWWMGRPPAKQEEKLSDEQVIFLQKLSRKTWAFFETFVVAEDNWLPPDNYQQSPEPATAHRTSPTNIGLSLLANLAAYDFGYIGMGVLLERTKNTIIAMGAMERYSGHFFNWYNTITLQPLFPKYISTVDSGNLAGHLLTLRQGLLELSHQNVSTVNIFKGLRDVILILDEQVKDNPSVLQLKDELESIVNSDTITLITAKSYLESFTIRSSNLVDNLPAATGTDGRWWADAFDRQCREAIHELDLLAPWLVLPTAPEKFRAVIPGNLKLSELAAMPLELLPKINSFLKEVSTDEEKKWLNDFRKCIIESGNIANERLSEIVHLSMHCAEFADMAYDFLYDKGKHLLAIGYNLEEQKRDTGFYDLLASEARLCTFVAIAQGKLPQESWFALGRLVTNVGGSPVLLSWSGSMFEYLMPLLVMPTYENTLLDQTNKGVVERQMEYGRQRSVPWGISESGYNMVDASLNYQYHAFGVPGLGLKRGLIGDLVISPYSSALSLMVAPNEACKNLQVMANEGFEGNFGFYEAIDYTPSRLPRGQLNVIIQSYMAHHQGMSLLSLAYLLLDQPMQKRFESELQFQATILLLQERIPKISAPYSHTTEVDAESVISSNPELRIINTPSTAIPEVQLLSNGQYHVMISSAGGGYSRWKNMAITRWREDTTCDNWGVFCYIYDLDNNIYWSNTYQPTARASKNFEAVFTQGRADFRRTDNNIETHTEVVVSPEDNIEMRRIHITNRSLRRRSIEITSYAEVVLTSAAADAIHPAFSNLFVQTEILSEQNAIICTRRPRSAGEETAWLCHIIKANGVKVEAVSYETDRMEFIGRGNIARNPHAMTESDVLSNSQGSVLDPIVSIRYKITLAPGQTATFDMILGVSNTREECLALIYKYQDRHLADRVLELAWTHSQVVLRQINASEADAQLYGRLAGSVIYSNPMLRADSTIIINNNKGQSGLWSYSISGDLPIVLLKIGDAENINLVRQLVQAHAYWRLKGLVCDLVIWNEDHGGYRQTLQDLITGLIAAGVGASFRDMPGGIFLRPGDQVSQEDRNLFETVARVIIIDGQGTLTDQVNRSSVVKTQVPRLITTTSSPDLNTPVRLPTDLLFFNGTGGFSPDGREYIITTQFNRHTPAPWVNVIANPDFGTVITEAGQAYTWIENAHEERLTPWNNDPVSDNGGEHFYIRDEETGHVWSPAPLPVCGTSQYITRHGFGYSVFVHSENGIYSEMCVFVDIEKAIKFTILKLRNDSGRDRKLSVTGYVEWVLGDLRPKTAMHIIAESDPGTGALFARNLYNPDFANKIAFFDVDDAARTYTCDRTEFIGRNGTLRAPDALTRTQLSNKAGTGLDPCGAIQVKIDLGPEQEKEVVFRLGAIKVPHEASDFIREIRGSSVALTALEIVRKYWTLTLGIIRVSTPDPAVNILTNGWLMYQTMACRLWARSGYYQSGGAFGFRDQLQDVMAITYIEPKLAREQILLCASRQFREGDVQHWWHQPTRRGVRTRCSDDFLWLPFVTAYYVEHTADTGILDVKAHFLEGRLLNVDEESYYDLANRSMDEASIYDHCIAAIKNGLRFGSNGLPLMGSGDWNDGMDMVGRQGKGESVWLAFFLYDVLRKFIKIAELKGDGLFAQYCADEAGKLKININKNGWDGGWYRRGYFDDGTPLGSSVNPECSIDSISQSWSVLSGAGEPERSLKAMEAVNDRLVDRTNSLIQLLDPPFDKSEMNPGYIKGYVPGVRENGGQYSHAAIWMVMAFAALGENERTWELLKMINPVNHGDSKDHISTYKVEPYVMAADVYKVPSHLGRGGWTWYTGSAGWMYQAIIQSLLGLKIAGTNMSFNPCMPAEWDAFDLQYRHYSTIYNIKVSQKNIQGEMTISADGVTQDKNIISLVDDGHEHSVAITIFYKK